MMLADLPDDALQHIFQHCSVFDLHNIFTACKNIHSNVLTLLTNSSAWCKLKMFNRTLSFLNTLKIGGESPLERNSEFFRYLRAAHVHYCNHTPIMYQHEFFKLYESHIHAAALYTQEEFGEHPDPLHRCRVYFLLDYTTETMRLMYDYDTIMRDYGMPTIFLPDKDKYLPSDELSSTTHPVANKISIRRVCDGLKVTTSQYPEFSFGLSISPPTHNPSASSVDYYGTLDLPKVDPDTWLELYVEFFSSNAFADRHYYEDDHPLQMDILLHNTIVMCSRAYVCPFCGCDYACVNQDAHAHRQFNPNNYLIFSKLFDALTDQGVSMWNHIENECTCFPCPASTNCRNRLAHTLSWSKANFYSRLNLLPEGLGWYEFNFPEHVEEYHEYDSIYPTFAHYARMYVNDPYGNCLKMEYGTGLHQWFPDASGADEDPMAMLTYKNFFLDKMK